MTAAIPLAPVPVDQLPVYPLGEDHRLDSHWFTPWERRRWLNSDMRLKGSLAARALYLDLIWISFDQSPIGTLPDDMETLAKLAMVDQGEFRRLCDGAFGPLHNWTRCLIEDTGEIRLMHQMVLRTLTEAVSRREDNRAKVEAASRAKRLQRLRENLTGIDPKLGANDFAVSWCDEWLDQRNLRRTAESIHRAIQAWVAHSQGRNVGAR